MTLCKYDLHKVNAKMIPSDRAKRGVWRSNRASYPGTMPIDGKDTGDGDDSITRTSDFGAYM